MDSNRLQQLKDRYCNDLLSDTISFWVNHCVDHRWGGFTMALDRQGNIVDTDKGVWQQGRFTWMLGELYNNVESKAEWLELSKHGADFLLKHCFDPNDGRMWFHVDQKGQPIRKRRYAFSECFASIGFGELFQATGEELYREKAIETFRRFVDHNQNHIPPKFTNVRPMKSLGFPMMLIATAQELRGSVGFNEADQWIDLGIETIERDHLKPDHQCLMESVGLHGEIINHFDGRTLNPGHAIEAAWFIMIEAQHRRDDNLLRLGCQILDWSWARGWDDEYGGILYFVDLHGGEVQEYWHDMKFWWPQNEAHIATLLAYLLTDDRRYWDWHLLIHDWAHEKFVDREFGEWFGYLHRDGRISSQLKGNLWKGPFHLPRMQLMCWKMLDSIC